MSRFRYRLLQMTLAILALSVSSFAQSTGALVGTVHDATGAVIQGATVVATDVLTGISTPTVTNATGDYTFPSLATGTYKVTITANGFKQLAVEQIEVHVATTIRQDATLSPGSVSTNVEVVSSTPLLDTETPEIGQLVEAGQITELPLNGRQIYDLLTLTAGTESNPSNNSSGGYNGYVNANRPTIAGERAGYTIFRMDGLNINTQGLPQAAMSPNVDAVQEFRSITQLGSAADAGTGSVYVDLKSGTNKFHGTAYDFLRNNIFDAQPYFQKKIVNAPGYKYEGEQLRYNQFGGTISGPIWRNRTFFLGSAQLLRTTDKTQSHQLYPTAAMLSGDFSGLDPYTGANFGPVYEPGTVTQFPGNQVPIASTMAQALIPIAFAPANCMDCLPLGFDFVGTQPSFGNDTQTIAKIEHHLSEKDQISGFYNRDYGTQTNNPNVLQYWTQDILTNVNIVGLRETHTLTPNLLNTFNAGYVRYHQDQYPEHNANGKFSYFQNEPYNVPQLSPGLLFASGGPPYTIAPFVIFNETDWSYDYYDNLAWSHGHHNITTGFEAVRDDAVYLENWNGALIYADGFPSIFGFTGYAFSDFLQGVPFAGLTNQGTGASPGVKRTIYSTYFQDDWKLASRLTVDLGLRYELPERWRDISAPKYNRLGTLDTSAASMANGGQFLLAGTSSVYIPSQGVVQGTGPVVPDGLQKAQTKNFQPRVGLAYRPFTDNKTVVRAGFGVYYAVADQQSVDFERQTPPWQYGYEYVNLPATLKDTQFFPEGSLLGAGQGQKGNNPSNVDGRSYQWSLSVERQLAKNFLATAEYVGNEDVHLPTVVFVNQPALPNASQLAALEANPANDATAAQARAPFTSILPGYQYLDSVGTSSYNALYVTASGQLTNGLTLSASYVWSKVLDVASSEDATTDYLPNLRLDRSLALFDHRNRFVTSWVYNLPFGDTVLHTDNRVLKQIISGWESTGIATFESGYPYSLTTGIDTAFLDSGTIYANLGGPLVHSDIRKTNGIFVTPQNVSLPAWGQLGTTRRNQFIGPGVNNFDLGFMRNFSILEGLKLQFRGEMFNAFNHGQFSMPNSPSLAESMSAPSGGQTTPTVTYTPASQFGRVNANPSRIAQVAVKLIF